MTEITSRKHSVAQQLNWDKCLRHVVESSDSKLTAFTEKSLWDLSVMWQWCVNLVFNIMQTYKELTDINKLSFDTSFTVSMEVLETLQKLAHGLIIVATMNLTNNLSKNSSLFSSNFFNFRYLQL